MPLKGCHYFPRLFGGVYYGLAASLTLRSSIAVVMRLRK
jgi:hypothetical protein